MRTALRDAAEPLLRRPLPRRMLMGSVTTIFEPNTVLGDRYLIGRMIGEGGMGVVYEATHLGVGRRVAAKVLRPEYASDAGCVARFERESRASAAIGHENIIDVFDCGIHNGLPFIVMEFLEGESLFDRLERVGTLSLETACTIATQVLSALGAAHAVGIVHRDVKPENIFLVPHGQRLVTKLLDFGVSKFGDVASSLRLASARRLTADGALVGTICYMASEQAVGDANIDARSDVYAVGVVLFEMLSGRVPFDNDMNAALLYQIATQPEGVPSLRGRTHKVPEALDAVVARALCRRREDRWQSAGEFAAALAPWTRAEISWPLAPGASAERPSQTAAIRPTAERDSDDSSVKPSSGPRLDWAPPSDASRPFLARMIPSPRGVIAGLSVALVLSVLAVGSRPHRSTAARGSSAAVAHVAVTHAPADANVVAIALPPDPHSIAPIQTPSIAIGDVPDAGVTIASSLPPRDVHHPRGSPPTGVRVSHPTAAATANVPGTGTTSRPFPIRTEY